MHRRSLLVTLFLATLLASAADAQVRQFPYKARVVEDGVYVRSGVSGGKPYYATQRLPKGETVTVLRHDPGGWYMIEPPAGSFSWVAEEYVRASGERGEITDDNVAAFVGSEFGDETSVWQVPLRSGDQVTILGQRVLETRSGAKSMLKIAPPEHEHRWIAGSAVIPAGENLRQQHDNDPFQVPSNARRPARTDPSPNPDAGAAADTIQNTPLVRPSPQLARLQRIRQEQQQLREIDDRFRNMVLGDPADWNLDELETDYRMLQDSAAHKPLAGQIDLRYPALERYRRRRAEFVDFKRLTSQTEKRDAQLLAAQYGINSSTVAGAGYPPATVSADMFSRFAGESAGPAALSPESTSLQPFPDENFLQLPTNASTADLDLSVQPSLSNIPANSRYIGAGILQRSASSEDGAAYVLTTPSGRVLAHVARDGDVDLETYVGQSVGLHGSRWYKSEIKSDYIEVSGLEAVKIRK